MKGLLLNNKYYGIKKSNVNYGVVNSEPLYFVAAEDNSTISITATNSPTYDLVYSTDGVNWQTFANSTSGVINTITLAHTNDKVYIKGTYTGLYVTNAPKYITFTMTGKINSGGNISSIINADNYKTTTSSGFLYRLFYNCTSLLNAPELPAINLQDHCYQGMFNGCTNLVYAQTSLPAAVLSEYCYYNMFSDCINLITAPQLPATTLAFACYMQMFHNCTSLVQAPYLPATELVRYCYVDMFLNCKSLNYIKVAFTEEFSDNFTNLWVSGVSSTGDFYYNGSKITRGIYAIPTGWTVHTF